MAQYVKTPKGDVILILSPAEARGLDAVAHDGAAGILCDPAAARAYIGGRRAQDAAVRALAALASAAVAGAKPVR
ncbi:hypothetical protein LJR168_003876 [Pseudoxanthomonas sp. LjRoot168]|uniref:hypothetical protein n=1 Tax=unclassified Pseudoxanthomonas TaxID=2645906 RepID=UPI003ECD0F8F